MYGVNSLVIEELLNILEILGCNTPTCPLCKFKKKKRKR